ncbi:conserved exported hypothetical protein [Rubrivivax sp. A210]|uniref:hypothetical protein n=1 Tax=Rubrivivax sp. A210 TaxID=2772301 RepID=UPI0019197DC2|nr:hypothetical protein [Rubrivivax sp. A210]CAD5372285.1 conserved exported hypothetical protein [Rubrivivax sp. A210]
MDARTLLLAAALLVQPVAALASSHWMCGLSEELTQLVCVADNEIDVVDDAAPVQKLVVRGTQFPLDTARVWTVDFWAPATDMDMVRQLANATLCYRTPNCSVVVSAPRVEMAMAALVDHRPQRRRR